MLIMETLQTIINSIPQLIKEIELLENLKANKENELLSLETQNQKLKYRLNFIKKVEYFSFFFYVNNN